MICTRLHGNNVYYSLSDWILIKWEQAAACFIFEKYHLAGEGSANGGQGKIIKYALLSTFKVRQENSFKIKQKNWQEGWM